MLFLESSILPPDTRLQVEDLRLGYGQIEVIHRLSLVVDPGEVVGLAGRNGAGKTTTLRGISGLLPRRGGRVTLGGTPLPAAPERIARLGVAHVPEGRALMPSLTVLDNLRVAAWAARRTLEKNDLDALIDIFPLLADLLPRTAGSLSGGQQQVVALSRGLAAKPAILMIDELSLGLAPRITGDLWRALTTLIAPKGIGLLIVDQNLRLLRTYCHRLYWLNDGLLRDIDLAAPDADQVLESIYFD
jgi:branched-chain amino acid transport system ATP-binding protein